MVVLPPKCYYLLYWIAIKIVLNSFFTWEEINVFVSGLLANTIHVPGDYLTIQDAINNSSDGDSILVQPGNYIENLNKISTTEKMSLDWGKEVRDVANKTLLPTVRHSWYLGANIPNKPRVFMPYAGGLPRYTKICDKVKNNNYEGFVFN